MMDKHWLERTALLIGETGLQQLKNTNILIVGLGGVGSYAAEFLARAGIGKMTIADGDVVDLTNINRQLPALHSTVGQSKANLMAARILDINPSIDLKVLEEFLLPERMQEIVTPDYDFVVDCIDSIKPKVNLILAAKRQQIKIISSMGAGGKTDPAQVCMGDISGTRECVLAQQVKKNLRKEGIRYGIRVVYSTEQAHRSSLQMTDGSHFKKSFYGTVSYMPALFGLYIAADIIRKTAGKAG
jgi:tRNA threonylcarbamoyladenosine dehydratase